MRIFKEQEKDNPNKTVINRKRTLIQFVEKDLENASSLIWNVVDSVNLVYLFIEFILIIYSVFTYSFGHFTLEAQLT